MEIDVDRQAPGRRISRRGVTQVATLLLRRLAQPEETALSVLLCTDELIHPLNRDYRGKDRPTDVLSFSMREGLTPPTPGQHQLGDVVIALPTARRQAREKGWSLEEEVAWLLLHGILHLLGYDHELDEEAEVMEGLAAQVWLELHPTILASLAPRRRENHG